MLLADFVRRADRRGTSERTSGGKAVTGATGSICHPRPSVKRIFKFFLGQQPRFSVFPPLFRLFLRTGETTKLPSHKSFRLHFRPWRGTPTKQKIFATSQNGAQSRRELAHADALGIRLVCEVSNSVISANSVVNPLPRIDRPQIFVCRSFSH